MTIRECAIIEAYTGICTCEGEQREYLYKYLEEILHRPIYTHELANKDIQEEITKASKNDFVELCRSATKDKAYGELDYKKAVDYIFETLYRNIGQYSELAHKSIKDFDTDVMKAYLKGELLGYERVGRCIDNTKNYIETIEKFNVEEENK